MLSPGLRQVLENLPNRLPFSLEVLDAELTVVVPDPSSRAMPLPAVIGSLRDQVLGAMTSGRPLTLSDKGHRVDVFPVSGGTGQSRAGVLVLGAAEADGPIVDTWAPMLRAAVEADLALLSVVNQEMQRAKHFSAVLRLLQHLADFSSEAELLRATLQAAAVWFDLDARVYRREPGGDFVPHMYLPAVAIEQGRRIKAETVDAISDVLRVSSIADLDDLGVSNGEALLIPLGRTQPDLVLVLVGALPADGEVTFGVIGRVLTPLIERLAERKSAAMRSALAGLLADSTAGADATLTEVLGLLVRGCQAPAGCVSVRRGDETRVIGASGSPAPSPGVARTEPGVSLTANRINLTLDTGRGSSVVFELVRPAGGFPACARVSLETAREVLGPWLGALCAAARRGDLFNLSGDLSPEFVAQLEQELARAKRFDLDLALVVIRRSEAEGDRQYGADVLALVRSDLRECDLVGTLSAAEIAAVLIQTGTQGGAAVVRRLRERLSGPVAIASIAHAVYSHECATVGALVSRARRAEITQV